MGFFLSHMRLLPREEKFYHLFLKQVDIISECARILLDGVRSGGARMAACATDISVMEHRGDEVIHEIYTRLNQTFITTCRRPWTMCSTAWKTPRTGWCRIRSIPSRPPW
jgi:uncharacterized protein Yka (UPF0111/DUF47 family)